MLKKIEGVGIQTGFFMNGYKTADVIRRINLFLTDSNWFSFDSSVIRVVKDEYESIFGEVNRDNNLHGKGISITENCIAIGYYNDGYLAPGNYLFINDWGDFSVGECYLKDGKLCDRSTHYKLNGDIY